MEFLRSPTPDYLQLPAQTCGSLGYQRLSADKVLLFQPYVYLATGIQEAVEMILSCKRLSAARGSEAEAPGDKEKL